MASITNQNTTNDEDDYLFALQLVEISVLPMAMKVAVELDLFGIISKAGPGAQLSPKAVASQLPTQNPNAESMLDRILRLLASYKIVTSSVVANNDGVHERLYGLASVCKYLVGDEDGVSLTPLLLLVHDKVVNESWSYLKECILEGGVPFNKAHGMSPFEYVGVDARMNKVFNNAMFNHTTLVMKKTLETYKGFENLKEVVDVGGGFGSTIGLITAKYPTIKGINFDLPHVIAQAPRLPGVEHVGGSMFEGVPKTEAIFMKWILHDWSDGDCLRLLKNCYDALPDHGKVIIVETILPVAPETDTAAKCVCEIDVLMMSQFPEAKERTEEEFYTLAMGAGFASMRVACRAYNFSVMEFHKK